MWKGMLMDASFGGWATDDADGLAGTFARTGVGLGPLAADGQAAQMANAAIALDGLKAFEIHADLAAQVAFNDVFAILNGMDDLRELLFRKVLGANARIDVGMGQDDFGIAGANTVDVTQGDFDSFVRRNFDADDTCHKV